MVSTRRFPIHVLNPGFRQLRVQAANARGESLGFRRAHAEVQHVNLLRERCRIGKHTIEVGLQVFPDKLFMTNVKAAISN